MLVDWQDINLTVRVEGDPGVELRKCDGVTESVIASFGIG